MKRILLILAFALPAFAAEPRFVTVDGRAYNAYPLTGAATVTVYAPLIYGGIGNEQSPAWAGKVVIVDRGGIPFLAKVVAVQASGGVAVILANNAGATPVNATLAPGSSTIPAVFVSQSDGTALKSKVGASARVGTAMPTLPDPTGHAGEFISTDGERFIWVKLPVAQPGPVPGGTTLNASAEGLQPFTWTWKKDGTILEGKTTATLTLPSPAPAGKYTAIATNGIGSAETTIEIK